MPEPCRPRHLTPAPVREENPRITVITGLEGPVLPLPQPEPSDPVEPVGRDEGPEGGQEVVNLA
ncbi:hypothetical protein [Streptomyces avicenniae]|uniref:hypothetical protein n=1 Tax=Streptomyces avicenniae TaxID=500153 RepID=UPI000A8D19B3|nr:hypothetical protein [Streptomyces avicenniae]